MTRPAPSRRRWLALLVRAVLSMNLVGVLLLTAWIGARSVYHSWHPCDWLLQDTVDRVIARQDIDPDSASIRLKAVTSE